MIMHTALLQALRLFILVGFILQLARTGWLLYCTATAPWPRP